MIGAANDIVNRADQIFIVGKGLSKIGTELLGAELANMTIGDLEAMLETNKIDPTMIAKLVHDFIDLAKALVRMVLILSLNVIFEVHIWKLNVFPLIKAT